MNWIKVTNDTVVPTDVDVLIKSSATGIIVKGRIIPETNSIFEVDHSETTYLKSEYSHYCVIIEPVKADYIEVEGYKITQPILENMLFRSLTFGALKGLLVNYEVTILSEHLFNQLKRDSIKNYAKDD